jgi:hypothetical protein
MNRASRIFLALCFIFVNAIVFWDLYLYAVGGWATISTGLRHAPAWLIYAFAHAFFGAGSGLAVHWWLDHEAPRCAMRTIGFGLAALEFCAAVTHGFHLYMYGFMGAHAYVVFLQGAIGGIVVWTQIVYWLFPWTKGPTPTGPPPSPRRSILDDPRRS